MRKIKILAVTSSGLEKKEGISTVILEYFSRFNKQLFDLEIAVSFPYSYELVEEFEREGIHAQYLPSRKQNVFPYIKALIQLFRQKKYDVLYIHGSSAMMAVELFIAKLCGCKVRVAHSHNTTCRYKKIDRLLRPLFYHLYTGALACGQDAGKWMFENRPFDIVKNGRDITVYRFNQKKRSMMRKELGISDHTLVIGHVGNFNQQKNQEFLVSIFREVLKLHPDSRLYLIGTGKTLDAVKELAQELHLWENIVFTGSISNVPDMLQAMDVMVLPSLHEGLPLVVVEWQIAALPCLLSDTITKECAYTDLVEFMSLKCEYESWARKIIELTHQERKKNADQVIKLTCEHGFDINQNALDLQQYFKRQYEIESDGESCQR